MDTSRLGTTSEDLKPKTEQDGRLIVNQNRIEEIERIEKLQALEEPQQNENYKEPLSIETEIIKRILLSWGGGEDGFKLYFNEEKELLRGVYYMADWGEYEETSLTNEEAEAVYNFYMGGYFE